MNIFYIFQFFLFFSRVKFNCWSYSLYKYHSNLDVWLNPLPENKF